MKNIIFIVILTLVNCCSGQRISIDSLTTAYQLTEKIFSVLEDSSIGDYGVVVKRQVFGEEATTIIIIRDSIKGSNYYVNYFKNRREWFSFCVTPEMGDRIKIRKMRKSKGGWSTVWLVLDEIADIINQHKTKEQYQIDSLIMVAFETISKKVEKDKDVDWGEKRYSYYRFDHSPKITESISVAHYKSKLMGEVWSLTFQPNDTLFDLFIDVEFNRYDCDYLRGGNERGKITFDEVIKILRRSLKYIEDLPDK